MSYLSYFDDIFVQTQLKYGIVIGFFIWVCIFGYIVIRNHGKEKEVAAARRAKQEGGSRNDSCRSRTRHFWRQESLAWTRRIFI